MSFRSKLSNLIEEGDLTNQVLEVVLSTDGSVELIRFKCRPHESQAESLRPEKAGHEECFDPAMDAAREARRVALAMFCSFRRFFCSVSVRTSHLAAGRFCG